MLNTDRLCSKCNTVKPENEFPPDRPRNDYPNGVLRQFRCKECKVKIQRKIRHNMSLMLQTLKKQLCCSVCGLKDFRCLQFHHKDPKQKLYSIARATAQGVSFENVCKELDKCIPICANCHLIHHYDESHIKEESNEKEHTSGGHPPSSS